MLSVADLKESELRTVQESDEARCTVRTANPAYSQVSGTCPWCRTWTPKVLDLPLSRMGSFEKGDENQLR